MESEMFLFQKKGAKSSPPPTMARAIVRPRRAASVTVKSVTRDEIDRYWRVKKMEEEEHLLAALKAAARIRARALSEEDYKRFEESLRDAIKRANEGKDGESNKELRVGIKDWRICLLTVSRSQRDLDRPFEKMDGGCHSAENREDGVGERVNLSHWIRRSSGPNAAVSNIRLLNRLRHNLVPSLAVQRQQGPKY